MIVPAVLIKEVNVMDFTYLKNFMDYLTEHLVPGNTISVHYANREVFRYSSGYADMEGKKNMCGDELINIYSCSKLVTVVAAMQLIEQGRLSLNDPLYEYISEYRNMYVRCTDGLIKSKTHITVRNLFTMTAGLNYNLESPAIDKARVLTNGHMDTVIVAKLLAQEPLDFEPGERWQYSLCHDVLAAVVEVVSGMRFSEYVKKYIAEPLGIENCHYHRTNLVKEKMAKQYRFVNGASDDIVSAQIDSGKNEGYITPVSKDVSHVFGDMYDSGGAGITTSVPEYAKLTAALANGGVAANGERILSDCSVNLLSKNQLNEKQMKYFNWQQLAGYGYGLGVRTMVDTALGGSLGPIGEFGWGGAAGATALVDYNSGLSFFYAHHMLNPHEPYYQPRLRNVFYACICR